MADQTAGGHRPAAVVVPRARGEVYLAQEPCAQFVVGSLLAGGLLERLLLHIHALEAVLQLLYPAFQQPLLLRVLGLCLAQPPLRSLLRRSHGRRQLARTRLLALALARGLLAPACRQQQPPLSLRTVILHASRSCALLLAGHLSARHLCLSVHLWLFLCLCRSLRLRRRLCHGVRLCLCRCIGLWLRFRLGHWRGLWARRVGERRGSSRAAARENGHGVLLHLLCF
mmetsp:Transcript_9486/g.38772  ORF Transcript_9486/g.38772 Transcript_9486/m.38772 type:complete len:227 (+) Transcript_9486:1083-1763(+)